MEHWGDLAKEHSALFISLQKSHLHPGVLDAEINIPNYTPFRSDRKDRKNGGVITYLRKDLGVKNQFTHSNSYCESAAQFVPELNMCLINIYRPPGCTLAKFEETLSLLEDFLVSLEGEQGTPSILCTGDMNLPFVKDWSRPALEKFCTQVTEQDKSSKTAADDKRQAVMLIKFAEGHYMEQFINTGTRFDNILDLVFCSDPSLIVNCKQLINSRSFSDHNSLFIQLSYGLKHMEQHKRINHASTIIPDYNLIEGDIEDWARMNALLDQIDWENELEDKSVEQMTDFILGHLEDKVKLIFKKKLKDFKEEENLDEIDFEKKRLIIKYQNILENYLIKREAQQEKS